MNLQRIIIKSVCPMWINIIQVMYTVTTQSWYPKLPHRSNNAWKSTAWVHANVLELHPHTLAIRRFSHVITNCTEILRFRNWSSRMFRCHTQIWHVCTIMIPVETTSELRDARSTFSLPVRILSSGVQARWH